MLDAVQITQVGSTLKEAEDFKEVYAQKQKQKEAEQKEGRAVPAGPSHERRRSQPVGAHPSSRAALAVPADISGDSDWWRQPGVVCASGRRWPTRLSDGSRAERLGVRRSARGGLRPHRPPTLPGAHAVVSAMPLPARAGSRKPTTPRRRRGTRRPRASHEPSSLGLASRRSC